LIYSRVSQLKLADPFFVSSLGEFIMAEHKDLQDPNLHEPKGTSSALEGQIYVADGLGSGTWTEPGMAIHSVLTDPDLHEPKGASTALVSQVYVSDGNGSGAWQVQAPSGLDLAPEGSVFIADGGGSGAWTVPGGAQFGSVYFTGNSAPTPIAAIGTNVVVNPASWITTVTDTMMWTADHFTIVQDGVYEVHASLSFSGGGGGGGDAYRFSFAVGAVPIVLAPVMRRETSSTDLGSVGSSTLQHFAAGDEVCLLVQNETAINSPVISDASFTIVLLKVD
jgi:hypothetical protein